MLALALASGFAPGAARAQAVRGDFFVTNGTVNAELLSGHTLYIGGSFTSVGPTTGAGVPVDGVVGQPIAGFPRVEGTIAAAVSDGAGGWYIGGAFTSVGGQPRRNLAHVRADLGVAPWAPNPDQPVRAVRLAAGVLLTGGDFTSIGGQARNRIAAVDTATGLATAWDPGANGTVRVLALTDSVIYAGGDFTSIGGQARARIAALDPTSGLATPWNPGVNGSVMTLDTSAGRVYVGGFFSSAGGQSRTHLAAIDAASGAATAWNPHADNQVSALAVSGGRVYVGGAFLLVGGLQRSRVAAVDTATAFAVPSWDPSANGNVLALAVANGVVYAGGDFTTIGGRGRSRVAALDPATGAATAWDPSAYGSVDAIAPGGSALYVAGSFAAIGGAMRANLAAIDVASGAVTAWNPGADAAVLALARAPAGAVLVGGQFAVVGGAARHGLAAVDSTGGTATAWDPNATGLVSAIAVRGGLVYAGGTFTAIGGQVRNNLAALDATSGLATAWNPNVNSQVFAILADPSAVTIGGAFTSAGGATRNMLAALDPATGLATAWNPNSNGTVRALASGCGVVYAGGFFTNIGGVARNRIALLSASTGAPAAWNPNADGPVFALALDNGALYGGGLFSGIGAQTRSRIAALDPTTALATAWNPGADNVVRTFAAGGGEVYAGGSFATVGGQAAPCLAAIAAESGLACPAIVLSPGTLPEGRADSTYAQGVSASGGSAPYCYSVSDGALPPGLALDPSSGLISGTPAASGSFAFTLAASTAGGCSGRATYALTIRPACPAIAVNPASLPLAHVGAAYAETLTTSAGAPPFAWSVSAGALPGGLTLSPSGVISGTPAAQGTFAFTLAVIDSNLCRATASRTLAVFPPCGPIAIGPALLPDGVVGADYDQTLAAGGGRPPYAWSLISGGLPAGLALDPATGRVHGIPTAAETATPMFTATDSTGCEGARGYTLTIFATPPSASIGASTAGLLLTPQRPCVSVPVVYTRADSTPARAISVTLQLDTAHLALCTPSSPSASVHLGAWFDGFANTSLLVTDNGGGSYTVDAALLGEPCGVTTGGTLFTVDVAAAGPDGQGTITTGIVRVRDCANAAVPVGPGPAATLSIDSRPLAVSPAAIPGGSVGTPYSLTFTTDRGTAPLVWSVTSGAPPAGLALDAGTGALTGTPTVAGTFNLTVSVTDAVGRSGARSYTVTIFSSPPQSQVAAAPAACLTRSRTHVTVPFLLTRFEATPARAVSVSFQLDAAKLALVTPGQPATSILPGGWLGAFSNTSFLVTDDGGGAYTVDLALLGSPCGITDGGELFTVDLAAAGSGGAGAIRVIAVRARDCSNAPIPVAGGPDASVTIDLAGPAAFADLAAAQVTGGNGAGSTTGIRLTWGASPAAQLDLYRAPLGTYPLYADAGTPPDSSLAPGGPWVHVAANPVSGFVDHPAARGVWDYVAILTDSCGATSFSNRTPGTLDYFLGDVSDGVTPGTGNNRVFSEDVSLLGAYYGLSGAAQVGPVAFLDVGPTLDGTPASRPLPDHQLDFEDLIIFAANFGQVNGPPTQPLARLGAPRATAASPASATERFRVEAPSLVTEGTEVTAVLHLAAGGRLQGFSARLRWDATVVEPGGMESLGYVEDQGGLVLSPKPGTVDAALLGARSPGITGEGDVARIRFRALRTGVAGIGLAEVKGRDAGNRAVVAVEVTSEERIPGVTTLLSPAPNPMRGTATMTYALARDGEVELEVFGVDGRRVRRLARGLEGAGVHRVTWDGSDAGGRPLAAGVYYVRLTAVGQRFTRALVLLR